MYGVQVMRGFGVTFMTFIQSRGQIFDSYGDNKGKVFEDRTPPEIIASLSLPGFERIIPLWMELVARYREGLHFFIRNFNALRMYLPTCPRIVIALGLPEATSPSAAAV